jgi:hypothetical protein
MWVIVARVSIWRCGALSGLALAACGVDDRQPGTLEGPPQGTDTEQGDALGQRGPLPEGSLSAEDPMDPAAANESGASPSSSSAPGGSLEANVNRHDFGTLEVGVDAGSFTWVISNTAAVPTGTLSLLGPVADPYVVQNGCPAVLPPGGSCNIDVSFAPTSGGLAAGYIQFGQSGQRLGLALSGTGLYRLDLQRVGSGSMTEASNRLTCTDDACTGLLEPGTVTLSARTENGSGSFFTGWSLPECAANDDCVFELDGSKSITATFQELSNNLIFVTSSIYPTNLGLAALDTECNRVASAAGINGAAGDDFIAAVSSSSTSLRERLGNARGWVRRDGLPVADTLDAIFGEFRMLYSPSLTEHGRTSTELVMTGSDQTGASVPENCNDWTSLDSTETFRSGNPQGSPRTWMWFTTLECGVELQPLYCMGIRRSAPVTLGATAGKRIWLTQSGYIPGSMTPDAFCQSQRPAGVSEGLALVGYTTRPAAAVLDPNALYVRPDGAVVGTGADIAAMRVVAGPWLSNDGTNDSASPNVWAGAGTPNELADPNFNCNDWTTTGSNGYVGDTDQSSERFFYTNAYTSCAQQPQPVLRCVEP